MTCSRIQFNNHQNFEIFSKIQRVVYKVTNYTETRKNYELAPLLSLYTRRIKKKDAVITELLLRFTVETHALRRSSERRGRLKYEITGKSEPMESNKLKI